MACSCCPASPSAQNDAAPRWRRALWIALMINAVFFAAEIVMGVMAGSAALQADALDFFGDAANYAISLSVASMALAWRSRAAMLKGATMLTFACWVLGNTAWHAWVGTLPQAETMGIVGALALIANAGVAGMFWRFRGGDANMRSVWICARNDAIGNLAVLLAALGVFGTGTGWPDVAVAAIMGGLGLHGGWQIVCHAQRERQGVSHRRGEPAIPGSAA
ncbi:cation transporter [Gluconobacter thailandicus]|uniref:Cation transporter n=1 Tax=Gluconobacter thailandicus TaxID=257438 RepID=A0AAP9EPS9_GLUTH|nr:cation transporter [Gluconobacter thailandicus]QEH95301.1 cation transporter [Gluconobacter thailandicus]